MKKIWHLLKTDKRRRWALAILVVMVTACFALVFELVRLMSGNPVNWIIYISSAVIVVACSISSDFITRKR